MNPCSEPKGREALNPAVPPFLRDCGSPHGDHRAPLGCCWQGSHPFEPTCVAWCELSSADRSGARSDPSCQCRAFTTPGSLGHAGTVLFPVIAGIAVASMSCVVEVSANGRRPSARCTVTTRGPPRGRAGKQLHLDSVMFCHHRRPPPFRALLQETVSGRPGDTPPRAHNQHR